MRVLGVDPGLTRCGVGVVEGQPGPSAAAGRGRGDPHRPRRRDRRRGCWRSPTSSTPRSRRHRPDVVAVERVFSQRNVRTVMGTAQVSGVVILAAARAGIPVALHTPTEVKAAITGSGRADKAQVTSMVTRLLKLTEAPKPADAADALALAICQLWRGGAQAKAGAAALAAQPARVPLRTREAVSMIASVRGTVAAVSADGAVIEMGGFRRRRVVLAGHARPAAGRRRRPGWRPAWSCARTR